MPWATCARCNVAPPCGGFSGLLAVQHFERGLDLVAFVVRGCVRQVTRLLFGGCASLGGDVAGLRRMKSLTEADFTGCHEIHGKGGGCYNGRAFEDASQRGVLCARLWPLPPLFFFFFFQLLEH